MLEPVDFPRGARAPESSTRSALGLDAAVGAAFLALLAPQIHDRTGAQVAIGGALIAAAAIPFTPAGLPVLLAALAVVPAVVRR